MRRISDREAVQIGMAETGPRGRYEPRCLICGEEWLHGQGHDRCRLLVGVDSHGELADRERRRLAINLLQTASAKRRTNEAALVALQRFAKPWRRSAILMARKALNDTGGERLAEAARYLLKQEDKL